MSLAKRAQFFGEDTLSDDKDIMSGLSDFFGGDIEIDEDSEDVIEIDEDSEDVIEMSEPDDSDVFVEEEDEMDETEEPTTFVFSLPKLPGSDDDEDEEEEDEGDITVDEEKEEVKEDQLDAWDYGNLTNFLPWLVKMLSNVPKHNRETSGLERAVAYLSALDKSISRAVRSDLKNELDIPEIEKARKEIESGIDRLEDELEKRQSAKKKVKKKSDPQYAQGLVKEAQKIAGVQGRIVITVPLIISRAARVCINGYVSAGHDIEDMYERQVKKYSFDIVQQAELMQLLEDMGYPLRRDRGFLRDEEIDRTRSDNFDWAANYPA